MEIVIHDGKNNVMIRGGDQCFELCEQRTRKGKTEWEASLWFTDLSSVINELQKRKVRNSNASTFEELKEVILKVRGELVEVWSLNNFEAVSRKSNTRR